MVDIKKANNSIKLTQFPVKAKTMGPSLSLIGKIYAETLGKSRTGKTRHGMGACVLCNDKVGQLMFNSYDVCP
jgi:hypothetical protein